jgi:ATP-dependent DNA helicase RecG
VTEHRRDDYSFTLLEATYRQRTGIRFDDGDYRSFGLVDKEGHLTRAGMLLADQPAVYTSRLFCTRWNGLEKGSIFDDALDDKEYSGNLMYLLDSGCDFVKNNSKVRFAKAATERIDKPDYAERAVTEALVNALIHRDYLMIGSEIHIDIYDDRVEISSPGGMYGGGLVQNKNIENIRSERRNPVIADLFHRMKYMERRGSGLKKIVMETKKLPGFKDKFMPDFFSSDSSFTVIMKNINYLSHTNLVSSQDSDQVGNQDTDQDAAVNLEKMILDFCSSPRRKKEICQHFGYVNLTHFTRKHLTPLLESGRLKLTLPDRPTSKNQKYVQA